MSTARQRRRGTTAQHSTFTGLNAELTVDTDKHVVVVHDGVTAGGFPLAKTSDFSTIEVQIHAATGKTTPVDADEFALVDTAASNGLKKLTWANLKAAMWTAWGALIAAGTGKTTPVDADTLAIADSAASSATKKLTWANLKATLNTYFQLLGSLTLAAGDILYASGVGTLARLAKGTDGQVLTLASGVPSWAAAAAAAGTARNRVVNPSMQISSINGNTAGTTTAYFPADNWFTSRVTSAGTITTQRVQSVTPAGSKDRTRVTITVADASLAAGEYLTLTQNIVGQEVADLLYGTASAKNVVLRFGFKGPAGTYAVSLNNAAVNRSYVALFTISAPNANVDTVQTLSIVGDTTGTWLTDTGVGLTLNITLACGSTFQGTTGWQAGQMFGTSGVSNGMGTISAVFEIFDVGLYADPSASGVAPTFETPSIQDVYNKVAFTNWVAYVPAYIQFGTVTGSNVRSRRNGPDLEVCGYFTTGTVGGGEPRIPLGYNGTSGNVLSDSTKIPAIEMVGVYARNTAAGPFSILVESGVGYVVIGPPALSLTQKATVASTYLNNTEQQDFYFSVPIAGWAL